LQELQVALQLAKSGLEGAKAKRARAVKALRDAKFAAQRAHDQVNQAAAAIWMLMDPPSETDLAMLTLLDEGVAVARAEIDLAEVDIARARRYYREVRAIVESEEARQKETSRSASQQQTSTIACPVAYASAIYADFGAPRPSGPHAGIDIPAPTGTPALASWWARVMETPQGGWIGKGVILQDGSGNKWLYAHLDSVSVKPGDAVERGQQIGTVGSTGNSTGPHLHFEIHAQGTTPVDPYSLVSPACGLVDPLGPAARVARESATPPAGSASHDH
jgi:murein DD-endopeptidase MepM/ murein hydrolase activator NlpD